jgi:threonine synthase
MMEIFCSSCHQKYPAEGFPYQCPLCGGIFDFSFSPENDQLQEDQSQPGIWRFRRTFGLSSEVEAISLGEGATPIVWVKVFDRKVAFKCEFMNPSGSFKDRGSSVMISWLKARGFHDAVEDSSGNAGASFAAYASRAGINARIFIPEYSFGPKRRQIEAYGAELISVPGLREDVTEAAKAAIEPRVAYASHVYQPFSLIGYATMAYEIFNQLGGRFPRTVVLPTGQGGLLLGLMRGFEILRIANQREWNNPKLIGVQASACAPLMELFMGAARKSTRGHAERTLAEGVQVNLPLRAEAVIGAVKASHGWMHVVPENEIIPDRNELARIGFYVEPTSAIVWSLLNDSIHLLDDPIVVILTGAGCKY